jgi:Xaa-Pro dipeptidase
MGSGPIVLMSYNRVNGYAAECERTVFLGEPTAEERRIYDIVMEARALALRMVKPDVQGSDIDVATQEFFQSKGHGNRIIHRTGHGMGGRIIVLILICLLDLFLGARSHGYNKGT